MKTTTTESLRDLLASRSGYHTYTATLGTNGNGGMLSSISDILEADEEDSHLDDYEPASFEIAELDKHIRDATGYQLPELEDLADGNEWVAFDCHHSDSRGHLTGSISRIYVNLAV